MNCPNCKKRLRIYDTRPTGPRSRYREYICTGCRKIFTSYEEMDKESIPIGRKKKEVIDRFGKRLKAIKEEKERRLKCTNSTSQE